MADTRTPAVRQWLAHLSLAVGLRSGRSRLLENNHFGPLRVQRPFYPEADGCAHVYLLHPPGGLVLGDELQIKVQMHSGGRSLITTPSAGKIYATARAVENQVQKVELSLAEDAVLEWLPQETIVFEGANGLLYTRINLAPSARVCAWDIIALGRRACGEGFESGRCEQKLELWRDGRLLFLERNLFEGGAAFLHAPWGLAGNLTSGTFLATVQLDRALVDDLLQQLSALGDEHHWGLSQKDDLFLARYLGPSAAQCRRGFELIWQALRPVMVQKQAVRPRIWNT